MLISCNGLQYGGPGMLIEWFYIPSLKKAYFDMVTLLTSRKCKTPNHKDRGDHWHKARFRQPICAKLACACAAMLPSQQSQFKLSFKSKTQVKPNITGKYHKLRLILSVTDSFSRSLWYLLVIFGLTCNLDLSYSLNWLKCCLTSISHIKQTCSSEAEESSAQRWSLSLCLQPVQN